MEERGTVGAMPDAFAQRLDIDIVPFRDFAQQLAKNSRQVGQSSSNAKISATSGWAARRKAASMVVSPRTA